jgi:hypothetical protein
MTATHAGVQTVALTKSISTMFRNLIKMATRKKKAAPLAPLDNSPMTVYRPHGNGINGSQPVYIAPATLSPDLDRPEWRHREDNTPVVLTVRFVEGVATVETSVGEAMVKAGLAFATAKQANKQ